MNDDFDINKLKDDESEPHSSLPQENKTQVKVAVINEGGFIRVIFSQPIPYLNMTKKDAREFAVRLTKASLK